MAEKQNLQLDGMAKLAIKIALDFKFYCENHDKPLPEIYSYRISSKEESSSVLSQARKAALNDIHSRIKSKNFVKTAFDTRRINQETERNPRPNLQYWHRSEEFISQEQQKKINIFAKLYNVLENIKESYGSLKEWHDSYVRVLHDNVSRTLRIKQADSDIFGPQLSYLEQLLYARYRLPMDQIENSDFESIAEILLNKDENLLKRGIYLNQDISKRSQNEISGLEIPQVKPFFSKSTPQQPAPILTTSQNIPEIHNHIVIDGNKASNQDALSALFANNNLVRKDGERIIERTISITIRDEAIE